MRISLGLLILFTFLNSALSASVTVKPGDNVYYLQWEPLRHVDLDITGGVFRRTLHKLEYISHDGLVKLSDHDEWVSIKEIEAYIDEYRGITLGDTVVATLFPRTMLEVREVKKVVAISSGGFFMLENGTWFAFADIAKLQCEQTLQLGPDSDLPSL